MNSQEEKSHLILKMIMRNSLLSAVYGRWDKHLSKMMDTIIEEHCKKNAGHQAVLLINGEQFRHRNAPYMKPLHPAAQWGQRRVHLEGHRPDPSLREAIDAFLKLRDELSREKQIVASSLSAVMSQTASYDDYVELLPQPTHEALAAYKDSFDPAAKRLSQPQMDLLKRKHQPYLALAGQRLIRLLLI